MNIEKLGRDLLAIARAAAPLIGKADELEAAERLVDSIKTGVGTVKDLLGKDSPAELDDAVDELVKRVSDRAKRVADSLD